jgi:hypothetical protein
VPEDFEWVTARAGCSPARVFQRLKLEVEGDVKERNALLAPGAGYTFDTITVEGAITVFLESDGASVRRSVVFKQTDAGISVCDGSNLPVLEATLTLNDQGKCVFRIEGRECSSWQLRLRALENLFSPIC